MRKSRSILCMSLLAASLIAPTGRAFADDDDRRDFRNQRHDLRQDQRRLEELKQERHEEIREGDRVEARDYNAKIREQEKDIRRDRKNLKDEERERHGKGYHDHD